MQYFLLYNLWSFKREVRLVIVTLLLILSLPLIAVFILINAGINVVSDQLATVNTQTQQVEIHDPKDGSVVSKITPQVTWPVSGVITLEFGENDLPYEILHTGIDIANPYGKIGDPIHPFMEGTVTYAGEIWWGFGKHIIIDNGNNISSLYGHLNKIYVYLGQKVKITDIIGEEGSTGWSTGPHIHFQVSVYGLPVNPRTFLGAGNPL